MARKRKRRTVTVETTWGEVYRGTKVKVAHELTVDGQKEKVFAVDTDDPRAHQRGRRYARASWIRGHGSKGADDAVDI